MAHVPRLFLSDTLSSGQSTQLDDAQARYLTRVMRLSEGATVRVFNGRDGEWRCKLSVSGKRADLTATEQIRAQTAGPDLILMFAPLKKARTDFVVEKACELGVSQILPVITAYTQSERLRTDRLKSIAIEASEQTERMDVPTVLEARPLAAAIGELAADRLTFFCDEGGEAQPMAAAITAHKSAGAAILIGPEGGFSPAEREMLRSNRQIVPVTLGPRILRAETAAVAALTLWQSMLGDWHKPPYLPQT